jgi:hypothetical protein
MDEARGTLVKEAADPVVAVDFDLTIQDREGNLIAGAKDTINHLKSTGWKIIIWTGNPDLDYVREFLKKHEIQYDHINENPDHDKGQHTRKIFFNATVDDRAVPFDGDWTRALVELEHRRDLWRLEGTTKCIVKVMVADREGDVQCIAEFALKDDCAVQVSGKPSRVIRDMIENGINTDDGIVHPDEGVEFLKALMGLQGTYLWAEIS